MAAYLSDIEGFWLQQAGWDWLLDTLPLDTNRKVMRDTATLSGCGQDVPVRLPFDWLVLPSHLSPLVFFNKEEMMEGQKDGRAAKQSSNVNSAVHVQQ